MYPNLQLKVSRSCRKSTSIVIGNETFGCLGSRYKRSAIIFANWNAGFGKIVAETEHDMRPGVIDKLIVHSVFHDQEAKTHILAVVSWYKPLVHLRKFCGKPTEVWSRETEPFGEASFMPVQRIRRKCVQAAGKARNKNVLFICPVSEKLNI